MSFTVTLGWWAVPLAFTVLTATSLWFWSAHQPPVSGLGGIGTGIAEAFIWAAGIIACLVAWLIWAVLT